MESETRLGSHQIAKFTDRVQNYFFITLARLRNRLLFYRFPFDMYMYKRFLENFYRQKGIAEKSGCYPLASDKIETKE
jgi:hypothetical protein